MSYMFFIFLILTLFSIFSPCLTSVELNYPAFFNFGDSNSDTGGLSAGMAVSLNLPYGQTYFKEPSGRLSDGRLVIDFLRMSCFMDNLASFLDTLKVQKYTCFFGKTKDMKRVKFLKVKVFCKDAIIVNPFSDTNTIWDHQGVYIACSLIPAYDMAVDEMDLPFLHPYLDSIGAPSFRKGCNFAAGGATVLPSNASSACPFSFGKQVAQFLMFKARVLSILAETRKLDNYLPASDFFANGLYMFDIGQNDLSGFFFSKSYEQVIAAIPTILEEFKAGIKRLYDDGARNFWVHNTGPLGCLARNIAQFGEDPSKLDKFGCVNLHNQASRLFNLQLHVLCTKLQGQYTDASVIYIDIFTIKSTLIANYTRYGFEQPLMACCGYGGPPLNYDSRVMCGYPAVLNGSSVTPEGCSESSQYVNWDGIHYTEAANRFVSTQILTGKYLDHLFLDKMPISFSS